MSKLNLVERGQKWKTFVEGAISDLNRQLAERDRAIGELRQVIAAQGDALTRLHQDIAAQEAVNSGFSHDIHQINSNFSDLSCSLGELKSRIDNPLQREADGASLEEIFKRTRLVNDAIEKALCRNFELNILGKYIDVPEDYHVAVTRRHQELLFLIGQDQAFRLNTLNPLDAATADHGQDVSATLILQAADARQDNPARVVRSGAFMADFMADFRSHTAEALAWLTRRRPAGPDALPDADLLGADLPDADLPDADLPDADLSQAIAQKELIDFMMPEAAVASLQAYLPPYAHAEPRRRSVLFTRNCYYNFHYLAKALRARGWDAVLLSTEPEDGPNSWLYHGQDLTLHDPDPVAHHKLIGDFHRDNAGRFGILHHYGLGVLSLFPEFHDADSTFSQIPWDIIEARRAGVLIGYSHSGCLDGVSQTAFRAWSPQLCSNCNWAAVPSVCSDARNLNWGRKIAGLADLFCTETDPGIDFKGHPNAFRGPLTFANDPDVWHPGLKVPDELVFRASNPGAVTVYHAVGNYRTRTVGGKNVKGTGAVIDAIAQLQAEGINIELQFVDNVPSRDNRFVQVQADIIVDQLNYGRYGALAREGMMLGRPVVGRVDKVEHDGSPATACIRETPIVHADEHSVRDVLRDLALNPEKRAAIGQASREHAIKWWSADRLAERFEHVYDHVRAHGRPPKDEDVP